MTNLAVLDSTMFYEETGLQGGKETPIVFLHGNPTSSHVWRNVIPRVGPGRRLAPDLIGMGRSGKPDIAYRFDDHARYLESWFDALALDGVVLVGHDWGGALAFDWAARHPHRVRGIAFMETIVRPMTWDDFPGAGRARYETLRGAGTGEAKVLDENFFIEQALRLTSLKGIADPDLAVYAAPYPTPDSRRPLLEWARATPINGEPPDVVARVDAYDRWLAASAHIPKLLLTFDGPPGTLMIGPQMSLWCSQRMASLEIENCGPARHIVAEDQPEAIGAAIARWIDRAGLR
jgi:haloalkane dehalogenase